MLALWQDFGIRQRHVREVKGTGGKRLPLSDRGIAAGDRRILLRVPEIPAGWLIRGDPTARFDVTKPGAVEVEWV